MDAANQFKANYQGGLGQQAGTNALSPKLPTISGAVGRLESLHERLESLIKHATGIADTVGGPRPVSGATENAPSPSGIVYRLNDGANQAHSQCDELENLLGTIARALG